MNTITIGEEDFYRCIETMVMMETLKIIIEEKGIRDTEKVKVITRLLFGK